MTDPTTRSTDLVFSALSDPTRRDMMRRLLQHEHTVSGLGEFYPMSFAAVQKHVSVLERAGLVTKRRRGRERLLSGTLEGLREATELFAEWESLWRGRIARIDDLLAED